MRVMWFSFSPTALVILVSPKKEEQSQCKYSHKKKTYVDKAASSDLNAKIPFNQLCFLSSQPQYVLQDESFSFLMPQRRKQLFDTHLPNRLG